MQDRNEKRPLAETSEISLFDSSARKVPARLKLEKIDVVTERAAEIKPNKKLQKSKFNILVVTWNLMGTLPDEHSIAALLTKERMSNDLIIIGTQECQRSLLTSFFCESKESWEGVLNRHMEDKFKCIGTEVLQGLHTMAFIKYEYQKDVFQVKTSKIKTGFMGVIGNKGAVEMEFYIGDRRMLFINSHLQAFQTQSDRRNNDLLTIVHRLIHEQPADHIFFFGDLNYRLTITMEEAQRLNKTSEQYINMRSKDQLIQQQALKKFLSKYRQADISFPPTYKMSVSKNIYSNNRIPGWTDRIFHNSSHDDFQQTSYTCDFNVFGSDHRPVLATFSCALNKRDMPNDIEVKQSHSRCTLF